MANSVSTPRDNIVRDLRGSGTKEITYALGGSSVSFDFFQGDLLWFDSSVGYVKPLDSDAHAAYLVGVALNNAYVAPYYSMQILSGPAPVKNYALSAIAGIGCVATFYSTSGETYADGDAVYWGNVANNPQVITKASGSPTHSVGVVKLAPGASAISGSITTIVPVLVIPQLPVQSL